MKSVLFVTFAFILNLNLFAQNRVLIGIDLKPQKTTFLGKNNFYNSQTDYRTSQTNICAGIMISYHFIDNLSINSGLQYNPQGIKEEKITIDPYGDEIFYSDIYYLRVPIGVTYHLKTDKKLSYNIGASLGLNYLIDAQDNLTDIIDFIDNPLFLDTKDRYNKSMVDASFSLGFQYKISDKLFFLSNLDTQIGLSNYYDNTSALFLDLNSKTASIGINFGIRYRL